MIFTLKNIILNLIPLRLRRLIKESLNRIKLNKIGHTDLSLDNLSVITIGSIKNILNDEILNSYWESANEIIKNFKIPELSGGVNKGDQRVFYYLIKHYKPDKILEIGTHLGCSTLAAAIALNHNNKGSITTIDIKNVNDIKLKPWIDYGSKLSPMAMIKKIGCDDKVNFLVGSSLSYMAQCEEKFDLIFLDGDHSAHTVYQELPLALGLLNTNGIILLHDYFPKGEPLWGNNTPDKGPYMALERIKNENKSIAVIPLGVLPWETKFHSNITSLALISTK